MFPLNDEYYYFIIILWIDKNFASIGKKIIPVSKLVFPPARFPGTHSRWLVISCQLVSVACHAKWYNMTGALWCAKSWHSPSAGWFSRRFNSNIVVCNALPPKDGAMLWHDLSTRFMDGQCRDRSVGWKPFFKKQSWKRRASCYPVKDIR